jgi:hypothetical protein
MMLKLSGELANQLFQPLESFLRAQVVATPPVSGATLQLWQRPTSATGYVDNILHKVGDAETTTGQ